MAAPYPNMQDVLNTARTRVNDAIKTPAGSPSGQVGGEILADTDAYTLVYANAGWQRMQEYLISKNFSRLINTVTIASVPATASSDPGVMNYLSWDGFFDGVTLNPSPVLPQDLTSPMRVKERVHNGVTQAQFTPMEYVINGIQGIPKRARNYNWTWDNDTLLIPGSTSIMDLEIRYSSFLPDFVDNSPLPATPWYNQQVPIMRSGDALSWYIAAEVCSARGDVDAATILQNAQAAADILVAREMQNDNLRAEWTIPDIPPATGATPYDYANTILNAARTRLDAVNKIAADVLVAAQPFTQQIFNNAYRRAQEYLSDKGYIRLTDEIVILGIPPSVATDVSVQCYIDWTGYYNGSTVNTGFTLPSDLMFPEWVGERINGQNSQFARMENMMDGLPTFSPQPLNRFWEWRSDRLYIPGASATTDFRIRYCKYLPDIVANGSTPWYAQQVPIARVFNCLSLYICAEVAIARPDLGIDPSVYEDQAQMAADKIFNRDVRMKQRVNVRRRSRSGRLEGYGWNYGTASNY